jgi:hypothetical protein
MADSAGGKAFAVGLRILTGQQHGRQVRVRE